VEVSEVFLIMWIFLTLCYGLTMSCLLRALITTLDFIYHQFYGLLHLWGRREGKQGFGRETGEKRSLGGPGRRWEDNVKMNLQ